MIIRAHIRLQRCATNRTFRYFVPRDLKTHGIAKGEIIHCDVEGKNWTGIQHTLKVHDCMGYTNVRPSSVEFYRVDIGTATPRLRELAMPCPYPGCRTEGRA